MKTNERNDTIAVLHLRDLFSSSLQENIGWRPAAGGSSESIWKEITMNYNPYTELLGEIRSLRAEVESLKKARD